MPPRARFGERFLAFVLDLWLFLLLYFLSIAACVVLKKPIGGGERFLLGAFAYLAFSLYEGFMLSRSGQTLGKRALGIAVVADDGRPVSFSTGFVRALAYLPSSIVNLGFLWALKDGRAWHDRIAGTRVVETREKAPWARSALLAAAWLVGVFYAAAWVLAMLGPRLVEVTMVADAQRALGAIAKLEESHFKLTGSYTDDLGALVSLTADPRQTQSDIAGVFDLDAGFTIQLAPGGYTILAHARDRARTPVKLTLSPSNSSAKSADGR